MKNLVLAHMVYMMQNPNSWHHIEKIFDRIKMVHS